MELVLRRHADAEDGLVDMKRALTDKGRRQAARVAKWLRPRMEDKWEILVSPALRTRQTTDALDLEYDVRIPLGPSASEDALLREAKWPANARTVLLAGHQPPLGRLAARLLTGRADDLAVKKGALWWFTGKVDRQARVSEILAQGGHRPRLRRLGPDRGGIDLPTMGRCILALSNPPGDPP